MNQEVYWPLDEKIIGVVGVAPLATVDFFSRLSNRPVAKDWNHPRVIIDSNPKIPSRGRYLELKETDPVPFIQKSIHFLAKEGASVIAIPCNTAHIFYDRYTYCLDNITIPNIIEITTSIAATSLKTEQNKKVLVLASRHVIKHNLYKQCFKKFGLEYTLSQEQRLISDAIESIKKEGICGYEIKKKVETHINDIITTGIKGIIIGCTELSILFNNIKINDKIHIIDSNQSLADICYSLAINSKPV